ncbi:DMT family transporter [Allokutzneria sp. NRRL B-24872]|uniref:DMT family transporter n=1 Tax=Allokutzneria sp. NRRL B-24872 TaxID=1137961 RepID=UPI001AEF8D84|nr:EamA family transporter [Allokutzneria sp. NRRL B-24872]
MQTSTLSKPSTRAHGMSSLVVAGVLWGTSGLLGTLLGRTAGLSPVAVAAARLFTGGALIVAFLLATGRGLPQGRAAWTRVGVIAALALVFQSGYFTSVSLSSVSVATLVTIGCSPVFVLIAERVTGRRVIDASAVLVLALALVGLVLLVGVPSGGFSGGGLSGGGVLASAAFAVLAASAFATMTIVGSRPVDGLDDLTTSGFSFLLGGVVMLPFTGVAFTVSPSSLALLAALALLPTAVAYTLYFRGLRGAGASAGAVMALLEPLTGTALAMLFLGERLSPLGWLGAALLSAAVIISARRG